ncbi:MAG: RagB/SusD family nutrient uptake outer membrane protein [Paludibacteraceae bacterium]|nr:RagB/SusD family nutrient uptake outer membrane protein [Paludibacteraceae bacterium]
MKKINTIAYVIVLGIALSLVGCNFLDQNPDMRASIDTKKKVQLLLVSAYTNANFGPICEFSSDQVVDNNAPDKTGHAMNAKPLDKMYDEIFAWEPVKSDGNQDSPKYIWDGCYSAIATCNQALKAIEELEAKGINMDCEKGEALISRAYHHFILVNVFCQAWKDSTLSKLDLGITYMKEPETKVAPHYERGTVAETYKAIQEDIEAGLPLIDDNYYTVPRYHFNSKAAYAFAARFYLYTRQWDKVLNAANQVLTTDDAVTLAMLYDAKKGYGLNDAKQEQLVFIDPNAPCNLLLNTTMSQAPYTLIPDYGRYYHNGAARDYSTLGAGPCWRSQFPGWHHWQFNETYGTFCAKSYWLFEYTDKVNGYGYIHGVTRAFTTNETLLCRAEAKVFLNDIQGAVNDFRIWCQGYNTGRMDTLPDGNVDLTMAKIKAFYSPVTANKNFVPELHNMDMSPEFIVTEEQKPYIWCALHFRRIETQNDGLRWFDLKRYGIEITHQRGTDPLRTLIWNDDRRAIQLPVDVRIAGMTPNPRVNQGDHVSPDAAEIGTSNTGEPQLSFPFIDLGKQVTCVPVDDNDNDNE